MPIAFVKREMLGFLASVEPEVLCIRGKWGTGKTHTWVDLYKTAVKSHAVSKKRYSYVSLFGVNSLPDLKMAIMENTGQGKYLGIHPSLESFEDFWGPLESTGRKALKHLGAAPLPFAKGIADKLANAAFFAVRDQIICLDDIERKGTGLTINDVLGLMSLLKTERECKLVIILNDEKLPERDEFELYLERVVDKSIVFAPSAEECADIALNGSQKADGLVREFSVALGITNIRVIKKIRAFTKATEAALSQHGDRVLREAIRTLSILCWVTFLPDEAPPLSFIADHSNGRIARLMGKQKFFETDARWYTILDSIGFVSFAELDRALLAGVKNGVFDDAAIDELSRQSVESIRQADLRRDFEAAWNLYYNSLEDNQEQFVDEVDRTFRQAAPQLPVMDLDNTIGLLKELGHPERADTLISFYFDALPDHAAALRRPKSHPFNQAKNAEVLNALRDKLASRSDDRPLVAVLKEIADQQWSDANVFRVSQAPTCDVIVAFRNLPGPGYRSVVESAMAFQSIQTPLGREAYTKIRDAVLAIAVETLLNAKRLSGFVTKFQEADGLPSGE